MWPVSFLHVEFDGEKEFSVEKGAFPPEQSNVADKRESDGDGDGDDDDDDDDGCGTQSEWAMMSSQARRVFISRTDRSSTSQEPRKGAAAIPAPGGQSLPRSLPRLSLQVYQTAGPEQDRQEICWSPANSMSSVHWNTVPPPEFQTSHAPRIKLEIQRRPA
ncbi:conserved hypothetical protein [Coccidioides posadasii str. Silveira]|uniref:Uncharacterized protein n=1 Tax=Coccidioides posadasii (strain RMSCC 757 / Silveira) TaxID=443226 RepID=E9CX57_COCPS|nr:conserved hypothetical protein [Coccidioides posadasii str. Silveira]